MNALYTLITGRYKEGVTDLDRLPTPALLHASYRIMKDYVEEAGYPQLTKEQKKAARDYYRRYARISLIYHRGFTGCSGEFHPEYMPEDIYYGRIEPYFTDRLASISLDNKCLYYRLFSNVRLPGLIAMRIGGSWVDSSFSPITLKQARELVESRDTCIVKKAVLSEGGFGVSFLSGEDRGDRFLSVARSARTDLVVQEEVHQHPAFAALHGESVNTLRLMTLMTREGARVFAGAVRMGTGKSRVDNFSGGGIFVRLYPDGRLHEKGVTHDGRTVTRHPDTGIVFKDTVIPFYDKAEKLVLKACGIMGHTRLASWDVTIDDKGQAVLIEANLSLGVIDAMQMGGEPLFGKDTVSILEEVFFDKQGRRRRRKRTRPDIRAGITDRYQKSREMARYLDNKCYYYRLFPEIKQPEPLAFRIGGVWLDREYQVVPPSITAQRLMKEEELVVRPALRAESGRRAVSVTFAKEEDSRRRLEKLKEAVKGIRGDIVIHRPVRQNEAMAPVRIVTRLPGNGKEPVVSDIALKAGHKVDNNDTGSIYCEIGEKVPSVDRCKEAVRRAHAVMGHHRLIAWEVAVDDTGEPVLMEADLTPDTDRGERPVSGRYHNKKTR